MTEAGHQHGLPGHVVTPIAAATAAVVCYYYEPVKAPLLRDAVLPAIDAAGREHPDVFAQLERHWRHGPHLRVQLTGAAASVDRAANRMARRLREHLAIHPSTVDVSTDTLLARSELAGQAELIPPPYTPIHPDNTVRIEQVDDGRMLDLLETTEAVRCRAALLRLGLPTVGATLARLGAAGDTASARVWLTVAAMSAHAGQYPLGLGDGHQSFFSHLEEFLLHSDPEGTLRARYQRQWERHGDAVTEAVARVAGGGAADPAEDAWLAWTRSARTLAEPVYDRGHLPPVPGAGYLTRARGMGDESTSRRWDPQRRTAYSDYHQLLQQIDFNRVRHQREFVVYRFATNVLYLLLTICDVTPVERYLAAYLMSRAAERLTGITWRERLNGYLAVLAAEARDGNPDRGSGSGSGSGAIIGQGAKS
ncbi:lantibiotic biosynthesis dehydratase-like protein [Micromonospora pisi]|uniref:Lantibiotic biosynthesis dehydratase-like protein n=1 Tax=Micromonospora pisi TaxID=589240 RepID=A0A495JUF3_9ACTN|nr:lantibiotic dehydratase C-terminal domain-containing protein [Micromonospora pisi]RKR91994.1 lantibiotic biosynthesis dehydratase-like protein [Micromonospora pisi]